MIESSTNQQIKAIQKLKKSARNRKKEGLFIAEGVRLVEDALDYRMVKKVYLSESIKAEYYDRLSHKLKEAEVEYVAAKVFQEMSDTESPQGVLAVVKIPKYDRTTVVEKTNAAVICLEDIQDPGNMGTIFRTAEGAGMSAVIMSAGCVDLFNPKVVRATMGAIFRLPFFVTENMSEEVEKLKREKFSVYAASLEGARFYTEETYAGKCAVIIGNEANGIRQATQDAATHKIKIPMEGQLESLNAAVSAAIFMYEIHRNR
ncbi:MAG: TrmH family RNA methyltransferase [Eubacterium sp.]